MRLKIGNQTQSFPLPLIVTAFDSDADTNNPLYAEMVHNFLQKLDSQLFKKERAAEFLKQLPLIAYTPASQVPFNQSFFLLSKYRTNSFKFFFDMMSNWMITGKKLDVLRFSAIHFRLPEFDSGTYTLCEIKLRIETLDDLEEIRRNLPIIESEIQLGINSGYYARRIQNIKGLSADEQTAMIQEYIALLISKFPQHFDYDLFTEMQHMILVCKDEFKSFRTARHLSRIIIYHYLFRQSLLEAMKLAPSQRHIQVKLFRVQLANPDQKPVLALLVGINFLGENEVFEEHHLVKAIQAYIPYAHSIDGSFFANRRGSENLCTLYLEIEKSDGSSFTGEEMQQLRTELPNDLKDCIEYLVHPVFMPRNEEEIMRNILSLSDQIKYLRDLPQVFISFDEQSSTHLFFTIIFVRILKPDSISVADLFGQTTTFLEYIHDFSKNLGSIRKKYTKEATVFRVKMTKKMFLRSDYSIDLCKARQVVVAELTRVMGEVRDFNGGMMTKQNELLCQVKNLLCDACTYNDFLLDNFFYSTTPAVMRTVLDPLVLKNLFIMMMENLDTPYSNREQICMKMQRELEVVYIMISSYDMRILDRIMHVVKQLNTAPLELATVQMKAAGLPCLGFIYQCDDPYKQEHFCQTIKNSY